MKLRLKWVLAALACVVMTGAIYTQVSAQADQKIKANLAKPVTKSFNNARLPEVLSWLKDQGVSFVVREGMIDQNQRVTLNVVDQPLRDVAQAIAKVYGGHWSREGDVLVFQKGTRRVEFLNDLPMLKDLDFKGLDDGQGRVRVYSNKDLESDPEFKAWMEKFKADMEKWGQDFGEKWKFYGDEFKFDSKEWENRSKEFEKQFGPEFRKKLFERIEALPKLEDLDGKGFTVLKNANIKELMDSLTQDQWAKHELQGHLTAEDLTSKQKALLGTLPKSNDWTLSFSIDGRKLTIKSK